MINNHEKKYSIYHLFISYSTRNILLGYRIPTSKKTSGRNLYYFPDYAEVTIPYNIAPLNFRIEIHMRKPSPYSIQEKKRYKSRKKGDNSIFPHPIGENC